MQNNCYIWKFEWTRYFDLWKILIFIVYMLSLETMTMFWKGYDDKMQWRGMTIVEHSLKYSQFGKSKIAMKFLPPALGTCVTYSGDRPCQEDGKEQSRGWRGYGVACRVVLKIQGQLEANISSGVRRGTLRRLKMLWWKLVGLPKKSYGSWRQDLQEGGRHSKGWRGIGTSCGTPKGSWMQEEESNREACESSNGCWMQVEVGVKIKIQVGLEIWFGVLSSISR
jgi:hypothetical protein